MLRIDPRNVLPHRIDTARLVLRAPIRGDVPDMVKLADNPHIAAMLTRLPSPYTRADGIAFVEIFAQRSDERPFAITLDGKFIGITGFSFGTSPEPELGYWLGEPYWGNGYMTEAARGLIETAQATGQYRRILARAKSENAGSINVLRKLRFKTLRNAAAYGVAASDRPMSYFALEQGR